ncbi:MAG: DNA methyltransferase [Gammaproteobacteria bacterium]
MKDKIQPSAIELPSSLKLNKRLKMDGLKMLAKVPDEAIPVAFLDPQYRGILNKMKYGNEGKSRGRKRCELAQMEDELIAQFVREIDRTLIPTGHLFLWLDKFELLNGFHGWLDATTLDVVDLINWNKERMGMGYRSRRQTEYCLVLQKRPRKAKGVWKIHTIPDTWPEKAPKGEHPHRKPVQLQGELIAAVSNEDDIVMDPAAGDFTVMEAARLHHRNFLGCDLNG